MKKSGKILALLLVLCLTLSMFPVSAFAYERETQDDVLTESSQTVSESTETISNGSLNKGDAVDGTSYYVTSRKNYSVAPDVQESTIITNTAAGNSQTVANVMEVNTAGGRAKIVAGYGNRNPKEQGWTLKTTTEQAHVYEKESGLNVVGGVNASWFNINTGEPSGYLVMNGVVHHDNSARAFVAAFDDGSVNVFREGTTLAQAEADQSAKQGKTVKIVEAVDALVAMVWDGEVVISQSGNGGYYPRTCVGVKADGTVVLFQADGTMAPRSVGYTAEEEARMMVALGCVAAIQLDEGGSSTYISQREGERDLTMRNTPAGGSERAVSGTILVVSTVAASGEFDHAAITPDGEYYTPGSEIALTASAMDYSGAPAASLPADVTFSVEDSSMGTVSGTTASGSAAAASFTSSGKTGDVQVKLLSGDETVGTATLHIQNPDKLAFTSGEVNLNYSESSDLGFKATYQSETVHLKDGDIDWSISDTSAGSFAGNVFTVTSNVKYSGSPTVTATRGEMSATVTVNIGMEPTMVLDGGDEDGKDYTHIGETVSAGAISGDTIVRTVSYGNGAVVKGSVVSDTDEEFADIVRFGHNAIKLEYDWSNIRATDGACIGLDNIYLEGTPTALGVWVYIPEGVPVPWMRCQISTSIDGGANWTKAYINFSEGKDQADTNMKSGWQYLEADMTQYAGAQIRIDKGMLFRAMVTTSGIGWYTTDGVKLDRANLKGYILIDNLCAIYGANNQDVTAPVVSSIQLVNDDGTKTELEDGMTLHSDKLRFFVTYHDSEETDPYATGVESAYFYFDGTYRGKYDRDILGSTSGLMHFGNGLHSITFYLKDGYGNVTRETRYFTVQAEQTDLPGVSLTPQGAPTVGKAWELAVTSDDLTSITSLSASISVSRSYPVTNVTFPAGVTGTWSYDSAKGVVTLQITAIDHAAFSADRLASVSVDVPTATTEGSSVNVQVTKGSYGCKQTESLEISDVNQYASGFTTPMNTYPVEAVYRIQADTAVVGSTASAAVTVIREGKAAAGVHVYANDVLQGDTDENGRIDISSLTASQGSVNLRAADEAGNCSYQITLFSYDAVGDETGAPYNVIYNLAPSADGKTITWMSNPTHSAAQAIVQISANADMSEATDVEGVSRLISYSSSKQINRVNAVSLTGLTAGTTYYFCVGDGSIWSEVRSFTVPAIGAETRFFLLADIQEEAALDGMGRIAQHLNGRYHFGVQLGDAVDNVRYYNQWQDALDLFALDGVRDTDMIHVIGNHEADDSGNGSIAAKSVFGVPAAWYSVERGDVYIAVLNHTSDKDSLQQFAQWLVEDAATSNCTWKVVVTHVPAYYTNPVGGGETYIQYLPQACDAAGIDFYFAGNDHSYARTAPLTAGQVNENGTVYYICGSTGGKSYSIVDNSDFHFEKATLDFDSVYVDVTADRYQATVTAYNIAEDGSRTVLDQYTKRNVPICENDEHTYVFDRESGELTCSVCGYSCNAVDEKYSGFVTEKLTGKTMYLVAGVPLTGSMHYGDKFYFADDDGFAYDGEIEICGEVCIFEGGYFVSGKNADVLAAGRAGDTVDFILYADGRFKFMGSGPIMTLDRVWNSPWYNYRSYVKNLYVDAAITTLPDWSVYSCKNLTEVTFGEGSQITRIGKNTFARCSSLTELTLPNGVTYIGYNAFTDCKGLTSLYLPDGINKIETNAFTGAKNVILSVGYNSYAKNWAEAKGIAYVEREPAEIDSGSCGGNLTWSLTSDGVLTIFGTGSMTTYSGAGSIPWYNNRGLITKVIIGEGVTKLTTNAFYGCNNLSAVEFAESGSLKQIGGAAFKSCSSLKSITLPEGLSTISGNAFKYCSSLTEVYLPDTTSYIDELAFTGLSGITFSVAKDSYAKNWVVAHGFTYVEREPAEIASGSCGGNLTWSLTSDGVLTIFGTGSMTTYSGAGSIPWYNNRGLITKVIIGEGVTKLTTNAFYGCNNLSAVEFAESGSLKQIGGAAFKSCSSLKSITLPEGLSTISGNAFKYCSSLTEVYLPDTTSYIDELAFTGLSGITFSVAKDSYAKDWVSAHGFTYVEREPANSILTKLEQEDGEAESPETVPNLSEEQDILSNTDVVETPETATRIETESLPDFKSENELAQENNNPEQTSEDISESVKEETVVEETEPLVQSCGDTLTWAVENGVLTISGTGNITAYSSDAPAPWANMEITEIVIDKEVTSIGAYAFYGLENLEKVTFAEESELTEIGDYAFATCKSLKEIVLPEKIEKLGEAVFYGAEALESVTLPASIRQIGERLTISEEPNEAPLVGIFEGCDKVVLTVTVGSYAEQWANENSMNVEAANVSASVAAGTLDTEQ